MKNSELFELFNTITAPDFKYKGAEFNYIIAKNVAKLKPELEALQKGLEATEEYKEYDTKRIEILKKYAVKGENGEPVIENNAFKLSDKTTALKEIEELQKENKEILDARTRQEQEYQELLNKESTIEIHKLKKSDLPEDMETPVMIKLFKLIIE